MVLLASRLQQFFYNSTEILINGIFFGKLYTLLIVYYCILKPLKSSPKYIVVYSIGILFYFFILLSLPKNYGTEYLQKVKQASQKHTMLQ